MAERESPGDPFDDLIYLFADNEFSNWGNLGHPGGYTSYDYAAVIAVDREKYSEAKLLANFVEASPAYITSTPGNLTNSTYTNTPALSVTPLFGNGSNTNFYVLR
jgi:hypothetical protein